jgi:amino acid adenylation domain-containing protein/non-ribosomal peptide synthase protein (TIGR01720 family)
MWVAHSLMAEHGAYNVDHFVWLRGDLRIDALRYALNEVVRRHEVLRTTFSLDVPLRQLIHPAGPVDIPISDLGSVPRERRRAEALRLADLDANRGFDLVAGPLFRASLVRTEPDEHLLLLMMHHLLADEWSIEILAGEVSSLYAAYLEGRAAALESLPIQYADYAAWQVDRADGAGVPRQLDDWRAELAGLPQVLDLPTDRPRPARPSGRGHRVSHTLSPELSAGFRRIAAEHNVTGFTALVAVLAIVLYRYSRQANFAIGTALSGRTRTETEPLIGLFANPLAIPLALTAAHPVTDVFRAARDAVLWAFDHSDVAFDRVVTALNAPRDASHNPVFQVLAHWADAGGDTPWNLPGITTEPALPEFGSAKVDLTVLATDHGAGIELTVVGEADLFEADTVRRVADHLAGAIGHIVARPGSAVAQVRLDSPAERRLTTGRWAGSVGEYPDEATIPDLFDEVVARSPHAVAASDGRSSVTYAQLAETANRVAHLLRTRNVGTDVRVGVAIRRSVELIAALVGILKAGGGYVALDPANPPARNAVILADSGVELVVTTAADRPEPTDVPGVSVLVLDDPATRADLAGQPPYAPPPAATPLSLAYVSYTSGSTGVPKGVAVPHRSVVRLAHRPNFATFDERETCAFLAPLAFDASTMELWCSLLNGAHVAAAAAGTLDVPDIVAFLRDRHVTTVFLTTGLFHQVVNYGLGGLRRVRQLITGGQVTMPAHFTAPLRAHPDLTMIAAYGPTENTTFTTCLPVTEPATIGGRVPIGRPIQQTTCYVLDDSLEPQPIGVVGELYTGGDGLARGYLNQPARTAELFLPDPFSPVPGSRMYRTGDLVRWRSDATLDFFGRVDDQLKVRGFRVEPGEIEARLLQHHNVADAAVVGLPDGAGNHRLVAYLVPAGQPAPSGSEIKAHLKQALPAHLMPATVVVLDRLPLNRNGKVDHAALPQPIERQPDEVAVAPRTATERTLVEVWMKVLNIDEVGIYDNFFDLGGDSLLSIRLAGEARRAGVPISSADILDQQTIVELAAAVGDRAVAPEPVAGSRGPDGEIPLTPIQHWFTRLDLNHNHFNQAVRLAWSPSPDAGMLRDALLAVVAHHDALRLRLTRDGGTWKQYLVPADDTDPLRVVDLSRTDDGAVEPTIVALLNEAHAALDLHTGPLLRSVLVRSRSGLDELLITIHHLAVDTVSWEVILADLTQAYDQLEAGSLPRLPAATMPVQEWAQRLVEHAAGDRCAAQLPYWAECARAAAAGFRFDDVEPDNTVANAASVSSTLDREVTTRLLRRMHTVHGTQINEVLLTALALTLRGWTGASIHQIDMEGHGRETLGPTVDVSRTVGWFTAVYPVVLQLPGTAEPGACLAAIRGQLRRVPDKGAGYGIARYLGRPDGPTLAPFEPSQLSFNYHGQLVERGDYPRQLRAELGHEIDPLARRPYLFEVTASVDAGSFRVTWIYPQRSYQRDIVQGLADDFIRQLECLVSQGVDGPAGQPVPGADGLSKALR